MRIGLVIQGARVSYGQVTGPNQTPNGFDARDTILQNIANFSPRVCQIVVSTWEGSGLDLRHHEKVVLLENRVPVERDFDNRNKQFISTYEGTKWLANNTDVTHVIKIRTDQIVDPNIVAWLESFYDEWDSNFDSKKSLQRNFLVFSEFIKDSFCFYVGDYIFAGTTQDVLSFSKANLFYGPKNLHPLINIDFVLKHLSINDAQFHEVFYPWIPYLWQSANPSNIIVRNYWSDVRQARFSFIPKPFFSSIVWRGRRMSDVIPSFESIFGFYDDWVHLRNHVSVHQDFHRNITYLMPNRSYLREVKYVYKEHIIKYLKHYMRRLELRK